MCCPCPFSDLQDLFLRLHSAVLLSLRFSAPTGCSVSIWCLCGVVCVVHQLATFFGFKLCFPKPRTNSKLDVQAVGCSCRVHILHHHLLSMGGTMMDSTKRSLAGAIRDAKGGGNPGPKNSGAKYFGAWDGGSGGTFGRAARAVGEPRQQLQQNPQRGSAPLGPSQAHNSPMAASGPNNLTGRRQRIRPNSAGAQSIWTTSAIGPLPKAPPPGTSPRMLPRPNTAQPFR